MAKERRARLAPRPAPEAAPAAIAEASAIAPARPDPRSSAHIAALYVRVPALTKRRLDVATAMTGRSLGEVVTALLDE